jgi:hypothetical protein
MEQGAGRLERAYDRGAARHAGTENPGLRAKREEHVGATG